MEVAEFHGQVMASQLHVIAVGDVDELGSDRLRSAFDEIVDVLGYLERRWSRFLPSSDVSRINQLGSRGGVLSVDPSTITLLQSMIRGHQMTAGRFDPGVLRSMIAEGYTASHLDPDLESPVADGTSRPGALLDLEVDPATTMVRVPAGLVLDPGGIGKGLAADLAVSRMLDLGVAGAMVEIGGDLAMAGRSPDPSGWLVDVEHADPSEGLVCSWAVSGGGVATSSIRSRRWIQDGRERHHHIDPWTGTCSTTDLAAVTVVAPTGWQAEVHATAALASGSDGVIAYLEGHGLSGIAISNYPSEDGTSANSVWRTRDLDSIVMNVRSGVR